MTKYFAKLGLSSKVVKINSVADNSAPTEQAGIDFLTKLHNYPFWKQCSKTLPAEGVIRKNSAGKGYTYDEDRDAFIPKKPYPSWILNEDTCRWEAPVAYPDDGKRYTWNETTKSWDEIVK